MATRNQEKTIMHYWLLLGLLCFSLTAQAEKLYRWVDAEGNIQFSDTPMGVEGEVQKMTLDVPPPPAPPQEQPQSTDTTTTATATPPADEGGITRQELQQRNCETARQNYEILARNSKVMIQGEDGKMYPIDAKEHQRRLEQAKLNVDTFCGSTNEPHSEATAQ
jgi:hypothetical protein